MKRLFQAFTVIAFAMVSGAAFAAVSGSEKEGGVQVETENSQSSDDAQKKPKGKKKTTEVSFDDVLVQGKYHFSDEAVTTVEQDKVLDALLGVRTDFKDRLKKSAARH